MAFLEKGFGGQESAAQLTHAALFGPRGLACRPAPTRDCTPPPPPASASCPQVLENYNKGKTALLSAAKVMVSPTEVDLTPELIFQQQPLPTGPPMPAGLALGLPTADHRNSSVR